MTDWKRRETELRNDLDFLELFQTAVEMQTVDNFCREFVSRQTASLLETVPVFIFNPSRLLSTAQAFAALHRHLAQRHVSPVVMLDGSADYAKTDLFAHVFSSVLGPETILTVPYDFAEFVRAFNAKMMTRGEMCEMVVLIRDAVRLNAQHLEDLVRLWERNEEAFVSCPRLAFVTDDVTVFMDMETRIRNRFLPIRVGLVAPDAVFDELLVEMCVKRPRWLDATLTRHFANVIRGGMLSLPALIQRLKVLCIAHHSRSAEHGDTAASKAAFLLIQTLAIHTRRVRPSAPRWSASDIYALVVDGMLFDSVVLAEIVSELKSLPPTSLVQVFIQVAKDMTATLQMVAKNESLHASIMNTVSFVDTKLAGEMQRVMSNGGTSRSIDAIKDAQLDLIASLGKFMESMAGRPVAAACVLSDPQGLLRKAFDADPMVALQTALKHPVFYLDCSTTARPCCGRIRDRTTLSSATLPRQLTTINRPALSDTVLLYRLSLECGGRLVNLVDWFGSFCAVLGEKNTTTPLLMARFFKGVHELQLIGMIAEFGVGRRRRRTLERFNITDVLELY